MLIITPLTGSQIYKNNGFIEQVPLGGEFIARIEEKFRESDMVPKNLHQEEICKLSFSNLELGQTPYLKHFRKER